jgi:putative phosphoesterase
MLRVGVLSDTHGCWDERYATFFSECEEIWHAGDIGALEVLEKFDPAKKIRAVCGNIDGADIRLHYKKCSIFQVEQVKVVLTHIGGYPKKYAPGIKDLLYNEKPTLFVCGHSHILKVMYDPDLRVMCLNPGAAGTFGFHKVRTLMRFIVDGSKIRDLEIFEMKK